MLYEANDGLLTLAFAAFLPFHEIVNENASVDSCFRIAGQVSRKDCS